MGIEFGTARNHTVWQPEPLGRGTYGLLSSCILTMVLCVWTAVHLNLPEHRGHDHKYLPSYQMGRKMWWLLLGLFAPEIVAWTAFEQRRQSKDLDGKIKRAFGEVPTCAGTGKLVRRLARIGGCGKKGDVEMGAADKNNTQPSPTVGTKRRHEWTMTHSYYAMMGGFAFDSDLIGEGRDFLPGGRKRVTLTSSGVLELVRVAPHLLPDISLSQITDKSNADQLAKAVITLQASWFAAHCISRIALGMTISLLELNTLAHCVCALIAYFAWWKKPLDISEPTLVDGRDAGIICAGMLMRSELGSNLPVTDAQKSMNPRQRKLVYHAFTYLEHQHWMDSFGSKKPYGDGHGISSFIAHYQGDPIRAPFLFKVDPPREEESPDDATFKLYMGQSLLGFGFRRDRCDGMQKTNGILGLQREFMELSSADITRLRMAKECYERYPLLVRYPDNASPTDRLRENDWFHSWMDDRINDLPISDSSYHLGPAGHAMLLTLFVAGLAYGGLHLLAWNPPVRTTVETVIWRVSGISIIVYGAVPGIVVCAYGVVDVAENSIVLTCGPRWLKTWVNGIWSALRWLVWCLVVVLLCPVYTFEISLPILAATTLLYVFARVYLVVECFISVGRLPESVFETPVWASYVPHIG